jgi:hypothetical protein
MKQIIYFFQMKLTFSEFLAIVSAGLMVVLMFYVLQQSVERNASSATASVVSSCPSQISNNYVKPSNTHTMQSVEVMLPASVLQSVTVMK